MTRLSLRFLLLRRLLPAMLVLLLAGAGAAYWVALRSATQAYDRALLDTALAIGELLPDGGGKPLLQLTPQARKVLLTDKFDRIFFVVRGPDNELIEGEAALPLPRPEQRGPLASEGRAYYDGSLGGRPVRLAALQVERGGRLLTVVAAETLVKRDALLREIVLGMLLPELLLAAATLLVVWFGIRSGLWPLAELRRQLAGRSHTDLRPLTTDVPDEIQPVVDEVNELLRRLDRSLASQRHFVSDAAHQLRTPIAALQAQAELALRGGDDSRAQLERIHQATLRLSHLVEQLLVLARAEPSLLEPVPEVALEEVIREAAEIWLPRAIERGIDLGFEGVPARLRGNRLLLREMLSNLIDNALRHTPAGGTVNVASGLADGWTWLAVEDSGPGVAPAERERVFERFYQSPGSHGDGCGLGLAIVRQIARQHGGDASVERSSGLGGAAVRVRLPAACGG